MQIHSRANARSLAFRGISACLFCLVFYMASGLSTAVQASTTPIKKDVSQPLTKADKKQQTVSVETEEGAPEAAVPTDS